MHDDQRRRGEQKAGDESGCVILFRFLFFREEILRKIRRKKNLIYNKENEWSREKIAVVKRRKKEEEKFTA